MSRFRLRVTLRGKDDFAGVRLHSDPVAYGEAVELEARAKALVVGGHTFEIVDYRGNPASARVIAASARGK